MSVTPTFVVLWMVCGLGSVTFAAIAAASGRLRLFTAAAAAAAAATSWWGPPDAPIVGLLAAAAAGLSLAARPAFASTAVASGGVLGGVWPLVVRLDPVATAVSVAVCVAALVASAWLSRTRPSFAPAILQDDARLLLLAGGLALAALPGILDGWQSAVTLNAAAPPPGDAPLPAWILTAVAGALALGGVRAVWSRR